MMTESWIAVAVIVSAVAAAFVVLGWALQTPGATDGPWGALAFIIAVFLLAAVLWPFLGMLLILLLPAALLAVLVYLLIPRKPAA